jgi:DNA-binding beta-propeller fold protein YncE
VADSITKLNFIGTVISNTNTISLPANSAPNFVAVAPSATTAYVTLPNLVPDPVNFPNDNAVGVVNTLSNSLANTITVGNQPDAIAVTPDNNKLYVANYGDNTVRGFNTLDLSPRTINGSFNAPLWMIARSDNQRLYVLNGNGVVSTLDITSTTGPDKVIDASINAPDAAYMLYDGNKNRLYIPGGGQLTMLDAGQSTPQPLGASPIAIPTVPPSSRSAQNDPCYGAGAQPLTVAAVAALPDGSRAYVGAYYEGTVDNVNYICPQVTVIDAVSTTIKSYFAIPGFAAYDAFCSPQSPRAPRFRITMAAAGDSTRAYLASCDGGMVNLIDTSNDTYILNLPAPVSSRAGSPLNPPQNPVFLFAGP